MNDNKAGYWLIEQAVIVGPEMEIVDSDHQTFDSGGSQSKVTSDFMPTTSVDAV